MMHECQKNCWNLRKAVIGNTVKRIGASAFANNNILTELTIGNFVETIEGSAFWGIAVTYFWKGNYQNSRPVLL